MKTIKELEAERIAWLKEYCKNGESFEEHIKHCGCCDEIEGDKR